LLIDAIETPAEHTVVAGDRIECAGCRVAVEAVEVMPGVARAECSDRPIARVECEELRVVVLQLGDAVGRAAGGVGVGVAVGDGVAVGVRVGVGVAVGTSEPLMN
jgi:hypothetical protein